MLARHGGTLDARGLPSTCRSDELVAAARRAGARVPRLRRDVPRATSIRRRNDGRLRPLRRRALPARRRPRGHHRGAPRRLRARRPRRCCDFYRATRPAARGRRHRRAATTSSRRILRSEAAHDRAQVAATRSSACGAPSAIVAEVLAALRGARAPGRHHRRARRARRGADAQARRRARRSRATRSAAASFPRVALHLDQRRGRARHPVRASACCATATSSASTSASCYDGYFGDSARTVAGRQRERRGASA